MSQNQHHGGFLSHGAVVVYALAQVFVGGVIGEPSEFVLHGFGEVGVLDDRVLSHLAREFGVKVGNVQHGFLERNAQSVSTDARPQGRTTYDTGLERGLNLLCHKPVPIDILGEERVPLDFVSSVITQPPLGVPLQQSGHHAPCFRGDVRREVEGVGEDPLVHDVHVLVVERG